MKKNWRIARSLKMDVYTNLKQKIIDGELEDNESITQRKAKELYGVSGTPFREAVQILESEGWVYSLPNKGVFVSPLTYEDVKEIMEIRCILETAVAKKVVQNFNDEKYNELKEIIDKMNPDKAVQSKSEFTYLDHQFHKKIIEYAENKRLLTMNDHIYDMMQRVGNIILKNPSRRNEVINEHTSILNALQKGSAEAEVLMHLQNVKKEIRRYYQ